MSNKYNIWLLYVFNTMFRLLGWNSRDLYLTFFVIAAFSTNTHSYGDHVYHQMLDIQKFCVKINQNKNSLSMRHNHTLV